METHSDPLGRMGISSYNDRRLIFYLFIFFDSFSLTVPYKFLIFSIFNLRLPTSGDVNLKALSILLTISYSFCFHLIFYFV